MQPLKLKEYLASGRPAVVRALPSTGPWADACDVVESAEHFVRCVLKRAAAGLPEDQAQARRRLNAESWSMKAASFWPQVFGA
jgi:hypothetical protein